MTNLIDRRLNGKNKSTVNRRRFIQRHREQIKDSLEKSVNNRSVTDLENGENIEIPSKNIDEPMFHVGSGGSRNIIHPGNDQFITGDKIERPQNSSPSNGEDQASKDGNGNDNFKFHISKEEYLDLIFEDLELPNLKMNNYNKIVKWKSSRAGYKVTGVPTNIDVVKSLEKSFARRTAMNASKKTELKKLKEELLLLESQNIPDLIEQKKLLQQITNLKQKISQTPFLDTVDLRFRNYEKRPIPSSKAVMFCLMDVSGSMDQATKDIAKRFYILLYLFLKKTYKNVEVIYIRHHTQAKEVDEHEFFYSQETGGTIVSSSLKLMVDIMKKRYSSSDWNIYAAQASDGDNWADDSPHCRSELTEKILPFTRYYTYIEITRRTHQTLWREYEIINKTFNNFAMKNIQKSEDIYPVFRELFKKQLPTN